MLYRVCKTVSNIFKMSSDFTLDISHRQWLVAAWRDTTLKHSNVRTMTWTDNVLPGIKLLFLSEFTTAAAELSRIKPIKASQRMVQDSSTACGSDANVCDSDANMLTLLLNQTFHFVFPKTLLTGVSDNR